MTENASGGRAAFTICPWSHFAYAATAKASFERHNPQTPFFIFVSDRPRPSPAPGTARPILVDAAMVPNVERLAAGYGVLDLCAALAPHCVEFLFDRMNVDAACHLHLDGLVTAPFSDIFGFLAQGDDCVLAPRQTPPLADGDARREGEPARGIYDSGLAAFGNTPSTRGFLASWRASAENFHADGRDFRDLAPALIARARVLHDPGIGVDPTRRPIEERDGAVFVDGSPVRLLRFPRVDTDRPADFAKRRVGLTGAAGRLFDDYVAALKANDAAGAPPFSRLDYGFARLDTGAPVTDAMRACFRRYWRDIPAGRSPFAVDRDFFTQPGESVEGLRSPVNRLVEAIYAGSPDMQALFDIATPAGREGLNLWAERNLPQQYGLGADWASCRAGPGAPAPFRFAAARGRLPGRADVLRVARLLWFYASTRLAARLEARAGADELAWSLAYSHEWLPAGLRDELVALLGVDSNPARRRLFRHWLTERDASAGAETLDRGSHTGARPQGARGGEDAPVDGLAIYGFLHAETGVGQAGRALARAFESTGLPMSCHAATVPGAENNVVFPTAPSLENRFATALLAMNADNVVDLDHYVDPAFLRRNRKLGLFFWELPVFPGVWARACDALDMVLAPTRFVGEGLQSATTKPVRIVPLPVPLNDLDPAASREALGLPADRLVYLVTFDFNSFPERKNPLGAVRAFVDAFPRETASAPLLVVKCHGVRNRDRYEPLLRAAIANSRNVALIDRVMTAQDMLRLQAAADIYVSLHRSEGFGLNLAECMAAGKLVIGTNFSGNVDFMTKENSLLVDYDMQAVREGEYVAWQGQWWAAPRHDDAVDALRLAEDSGALRARLGAAARSHVATELSNERVGLRLAELIRDRI